MGLQQTNYSQEFSYYQSKEYRIGKKSFGIEKIEKTLRDEFGYRRFKSPEQGLVTLKALNNESIFAALATGSGKSTAFLLPAYLRGKDGFTLVVSPLKALMNQFTEQHPWVETINGDVPEKWKVWRDIEKKRVHLLLAAPETLRDSRFRRQLIRSIKKGGRRLDCLVLDEVHCVSDWGHEFRPEYWWVAEHLEDLERLAGRKRLQRVMLTATANEHVQEEVLSLFGFDGRKELPSGNIIRGSAARPEIYLAACFCRNPKEKFKWTKKFLRRQANRWLPNGTKRRVLVYTQEAVDNSIDDGDLMGSKLLETKKKRRLKANQIATLIEKCSTKRCRIKAKTFTARGMDVEGRERAKRFFENAKSELGQIRTIVATSAFGMGMDYKRIPGILHFYPRPSLSEYWQQVGRSGRGLSFEEGEWAEALGLFCEGDMVQTRFQASAQALDGIINSFTIPALNFLVAWDNPPGSSKVALRTATGRRSGFGKMIEYLQSIDVLGRERELNIFPKKYGKSYAFPVQIDKLRSVKDRLRVMVDSRGALNKHTKKYVRYLRIAAHSTPKKLIRLDQGDFNLDRFQTVLSRLSRWADISAIERDHNLGRPGIVTLRVKRKKLTKQLVARIRKEWEKWAKVKEKDFYRQEEVLKASGHMARCKLIHKAYLCNEAPKARSEYSRKHPADRVPRWLN